MARWTLDAKHQLGALIDKGLTASEVARQMRRTRNAVMGQAWRRGWSFGKPRPPETLKIPERPQASTYVRPVNYPWRGAVAFDGEMIAAVRKLAADHGCSQSEAIRTLVQWGIDSMEASQ